MLFDDTFVFMMVYLDDEKMDMAGNKYPLHGHVIAQEFSNDVDIQKGLYGILWGKTDHLIYEKLYSGHWAILKVEKNNELICVDKFSNRYKFKTGEIVYNGIAWSCSKYIIQHQNDPEILEEAKYLKIEDLVGSKFWNKKRREEKKTLTTVPSIEKLSAKDDPNHWTKGKTQIATKESCSLDWNFGKGGKYFRCHLCGHKFVPGDQWRFLYGLNKCRNLMVCGQCDDKDENLRDKFAEIEEKYSWIWKENH